MTSRFCRWKPWKLFFQKLKDGALRLFPFILAWYIIGLFLNPPLAISKWFLGIITLLDKIPIDLHSLIIFLGVIVGIFIYGVVMTSDPVNKHIEPLINRAKPGNVIIELFKFIFKIRGLELDYVGITNTRFPNILDIVFVTKVTKFDALGTKIVTVVFPSFPIPLTGGTVNFVLESKVIRLDWTWRQAFFWIMSGGKSDVPPIPEKIIHDFSFKQGAFSAFST